MNQVKFEKKKQITAAVSDSHQTIANNNLSMPDKIPVWSDIL